MSPLRQEKSHEKIWPVLLPHLRENLYRREKSLNRLGLVVATGDIVDVGTSAAQAVGRYFSVISVVPSVICVAYVYLLIASGSWSHPPDWSHAIHSLEHLGVGGVAFLSIIAFGLGLAIHPLQFAVVQFFEGYWGVSPVALSVRSERIIRYQRRYREIDDLGIAASDLLQEWEERTRDAGESPTLRLTPAHQAPLRTVVDETNRFLDSNRPPADASIMPTRLGNVLRSFEMNAGSQYGLDSLMVVPRLLLVAPANHVDYVNDQRSQLDLAVRMILISLIASAATVFFLWPYPLWALIGIIPYAIAYLSYRGSVVAARGYGSALKILIDLNRFTLYEQLHIKVPDSNDEERWTNRQVSLLLQGEGADIIYRHPDGKVRDLPS